MSKNWNQIKTFTMIVPKSLNRFCDNYQPTLQAMGIVVGLYLIYLTYQSVEISNKQLQLALKQESQKVLPIWNFEINDSLSLAKMHSFSQDVKLEIATAHFPKDLFYKSSTTLNIDSPDFNFHLNSVKSYLEELVLANSTYKDSIISLSMRNELPVGIETSYVQYGQLKNTKSIFVIQYTWVRSNEYTAEITINGIRFMKYLAANENLDNELDKIIAKNYSEFKRPKPR
jgi:hypothetical protein